ncbi:HlyD family secretion protein [Solitalea koreensis]|uniref:HlyD family secretion protein n=1 Tax=Solitalea koreensis TaxID=543615 RepID=A0A521DNM2_9SPHI|nr:HlyD family efflux transporter periplasmic adaptor subunit [Solitalea koreensis]SMO73324.1 HlyD family secretion protein [Solitalea koreensis]
MKSAFIIALSALVVASCQKKQNDFDASGAFETEETIISAEVAGTIQQFNVEEGQTLQAGQVVGYIDSLQLYLKKKQLESQIESTLSQKPNISAQLASLEAQLKAAERDQQRFSNLLKADATTQKQVDDINAQVDVLKKQIAAQKSSLNITTESISQQTNPLKIQIEQINDQLAKSRIINPITGTVLTKYVEPNEMATPGKPLYKIADISSLFLRAYITGTQLSQIKLNQKVRVMVDDGADKYQEHEGIITWISDKAEFTPKTIQTKEERANLVYATKIRVKNDGSLKIGMYGEVQF